MEIVNVVLGSVSFVAIVFTAILASQQLALAKRADEFFAVRIATDHSKNILRVTLAEDEKSDDETEVELPLDCRICLPFRLENRGIALAENVFLEVHAKADVFSDVSCAVDFYTKQSNGEDWWQIVIPFKIYEDQEVLFPISLRYTGPVDARPMVYTEIHWTDSHLTDTRPGYGSHFHTLSFKTAIN